MPFTIETLKESDIEAAVTLFRYIIDELHAKSLEVERLHFKDIVYGVGPKDDRLRDQAVGDGAQRRAADWRDGQ